MLKILIDFRVVQHYRYLAIATFTAKILQMQPWHTSDFCTCFPKLKNIDFITPSLCIMRVSTMKRWMRRVK